MNGSGKIVQLVNPTNNQDAATKRYVDTSIPVGGIIMWSGTIASIPTNWRLCDGTTYGSVVTPDLRNRFIIGASLDTATAHTPGGSGGISRAHTSIETPTNYVTGGSKDAVVVSHSHGITDSGHQHNFAYKGGNGSLWTDTTNPPPDPWGGASAETRERLTTKNSTGITIKSEGVDGANKNLPPYYALAFIMRVL